MLNPERCLLPCCEWPDQLHRSRVYCSDREWYQIVQRGLELQIFTTVEEKDIFRNQHGELVLNGAMGVDKYKEIDGVMHHFLRFISILCPINSYMRRLRGDVCHLPFVPQLSLVLLEEGEMVSIDSEDMV
eukprot:6469574-Amphidinium_carterae.1